jgi:hypothetical protein
MSSEILEDIVSGKIVRCPCCGELPELLIQTTRSFNYERMSFVEGSLKAYQFSCDFCKEHTPVVSSARKALSIWNMMAQSGFSIHVVEDVEGGEL